MAHKVYIYRIALDIGKKEQILAQHHANQAVQVEKYQILELLFSYDLLFFRRAIKLF